MIRWQESRPPFQLDYEYNVRPHAQQGRSLRTSPSSFIYSESLSLELFCDAWTRQKSNIVQDRDQHEASGQASSSGVLK